MYRIATLGTKGAMKIKNGKQSIYSNLNIGKKKIQIKELSRPKKGVSTSKKSRCMVANTHRSPRVRLLDRQNGDDRFDVDVVGTNNGPRSYISVTGLDPHWHSG